MCPCLPAFQTEGKLYLILDFLRGGDVFTRLSKEVSGRPVALHRIVLEAYLKRKEQHVLFVHNLMVFEGVLNISVKIRTSNATMFF